MNLAQRLALRVPPRPRGLGLSISSVLGSAKKKQKKIVEQAKKKIRAAASAVAKGAMTEAELGVEAERVKAEAKQAWTLPMLIGAGALVVLGGSLLLYFARKARRG